MPAYDHLRDTLLAEGEWAWNSDRALLYAVGVGAGLQDPLAERQFTTENTPGLPQQVLPTFLSLFNMQSGWVERLGWALEGGNTVGIVHGEQVTALRRPIPTAGRARLRKLLRGVYDKGSGALVVMETEIRLADSDELLGTTCMKLFAIGKGGFGGPRQPPDEQAWALPQTSPDVTIDLPVGLNQSLIYRLSGDHHPHGTDPGRAKADGFERPIFYGLGSYGVACRALLMALCEGDASRFGQMSVRFSKPVYPGDTLRTHIWRTEGGALFQTTAGGDRVSLDRGVFRYR